MKNRPLLLIAISVALGVLVWFDNRPDDGPERPVSAQRQPSGVDSEGAGDGAYSAESEKAFDRKGVDQKQISNPLEALDKEVLENMVERPLFASSRKRPPPSTDSSPNDAKPPPSFELMGVVVDGDRAIALLRNSAEGSSYRVQTGDMIGGWKVSRVDVKSILIEREDGTSQTLQLEHE